MDRGKNSPEKVELVSLGGLEKATSGKVLFEFRKMSFGLADLVIQGKYNREWAASRIEKLRREGKLTLKERAAATGSKKARAKGDGTGKVDEPDPEGGDDL